MLTFRDCIDMAGLTEEEVKAIARHEHIPAMVALELGDRLIQSEDGAARLRDFIVDNVRDARGRSNCRDCAEFGRVLGHFIESHPECRESGPERAKELADAFSIGLAERMLRELEDLPNEARTAVEGIDEAKRGGDCRACEDFCRQLLRCLDL